MFYVFAFICYKRLELDSLFRDLGLKNLVRLFLIYLRLSEMETPRVLARACLISSHGVALELAKAKMEAIERILGSPTDFKGRDKDKVGWACIGPAGLWRRWEAPFLCLSSLFPARVLHSLSLAAGWLSLFSCPNG